MGYQNSHNPSQGSAALLVLASASPRRQALLQALELPFEVMPAAIDEVIPPDVDTAAATLVLARAKAEAVLSLRKEFCVLGLDTLVELDREPLGKPAGGSEAREMLRRLRGREHSVHTGVSLRSDTVALEALVSTRVRMRAYADAEIELTIERGTPFDKAGAYAIQDEHFAPVASIEGCYCNVMGLPLWTARELLRAAGFPGPIQRPTIRRPVCSSCPLRDSSPEPQR